MEEKLAIFITDVSVYSVTLPILVGLFRYYDLKDVQKVILLLVLLSVSTEVAAKWLGDEGGIQTLVYYLFTILEFGLLTYIFAQGIKPFLKYSFFWGMAISFLFFVLTDMIWISGISQFNSYSTAIEGLILIFFSLIFFYKTLHELKI